MKTKEEVQEQLTALQREWLESDKRSDEGLSMEEKFDRVFAEQKLNGRIQSLTWVLYGTEF